MRNVQKRISPIRPFHHQPRCFQVLFIIFLCRRFSAARNIFPGKRVHSPNPYFSEYFKRKKGTLLSCAWLCAEKWLVVQHNHPYFSKFTSSHVFSKGEIFFIILAEQTDPTTIWAIWWTPKKSETTCQSVLNLAYSKLLPRIWTCPPKILFNIFCWKFQRQWKREDGVDCRLIVGW